MEDIFPAKEDSSFHACEDVRNLSDDGDMATHMDSYERVMVSDSPILLNLNFENLVDADRMANFSNSREAGSSSDKSFQGVLGQEEKLRGEGPSVEKFRVVKAVLSGPPGLFQADRTEPISSSEASFWGFLGCFSTVWCFCLVLLLLGLLGYCWWWVLCLLVVACFGVFARAIPVVCLQFGFCL
ncbi:hypothetical protein Q3G72_020864 [Acer saccharum]|nr:hypothetical protein Q3G72_020864 [Acer saccharum]